MKEQEAMLAEYNTLRAELIQYQQMNLQISIFTLPVAAAVIAYGLQQKYSFAFLAAIAILLTALWYSISVLASVGSIGDDHGFKTRKGKSCLRKTCHSRHCNCLCCVQSYLSLFRLVFYSRRKCLYSSHVQWSHSHCSRAVKHWIIQSFAHCVSTIHCGCRQELEAIRRRT